MSGLYKNNNIVKCHRGLSNFFLGQWLYVGSMCKESKGLKNERGEVETLQWVCMMERKSKESLLDACIV